LGEGIPDNILDQIKRKIILFDGEQTKFIFDEDKVNVTLVSDETNFEFTAGFSKAINQRVSGTYVTSLKNEGDLNITASAMWKTKKEHPLGVLSCLVQLANVVQLQSHSALLVCCIVLVQQALGGGLINGLHCDLVSALGLGAIAFNGSSLELLDSSLQCGLIGLVASVSHLCHQNTLLSRLNIRQTKHLPGVNFCALGENSPTQIDILASLSRNCKHFFNFF
jgi:hypothetical protein